jgi:phosphoribosylanthranilate isomerase
MRADDPAALIRSLQGKGLRIKVCGLTQVEDALLCGELGVKMLGLNFSSQSKRSLSPGRARALIEAVRPRFPEIEFVGVFVNQPIDFVRAVGRDLHLDAVQLHGDESPAYVRDLGAPFTIKTLRVNGRDSWPNVEDYDCEAILLDSFSPTERGGTGTPFDWSVATAVRKKVKRLILAGGLTPENVQGAMQMVQPFAVDVCSGVEEAPGKKSGDKLRRFVTAATG